MSKNNVINFLEFCINKRYFIIAVILIIVGLGKDATQDFKFFKAFSYSPSTSVTVVESKKVPYKKFSIIVDTSEIGPTYSAPYTPVFSVEILIKDLREKIQENYPEKPTDFLKFQGKQNGV